MDMSNGSPSSVNLVVTTAPILPGAVKDCALVATAGLAVDDENDCSGASVAGVQAYARSASSASPAGDGDEPLLVIPMADFKSPITTMSRFMYGVNAMIFANELKWRTWTLPAYTVIEGRLELNTLYDAQNPTFVPLLSNVVTSPIQSWHPYVKPVHFDEETRLAVIYLTKEYLSNTDPQIEAAYNLLLYIYKYNAARYCPSPQSDIIPSALPAFAEVPFSTWWRNKGEDVLAAYEAANADAAGNRTTPVETTILFPPKPTNTQVCFTPVIVYDSTQKDVFDAFMKAFNTSNHNATESPPHLIVDIQGHLQQNDSMPFVEQLRPADATPTWVVSYKTSKTAYHQLRLNVAANQSYIESVEVVEANLEQLPDEVKTDDYYQDLDNIRQYAAEAWHTSLVKEPGALTKEMPAPTLEDGYRVCYEGECAFGNLFADALRSIDNADVAFLPSLLFDGRGWSEGEVRYLELHENLPFSGRRCGGTMSGLSLLRLLRYSIAKASFNPYGGNHDGGMLLQVSGLKIVYNIELPEDDRILSVDVWDKAEEAYVPLQRKTLYNFTTETHMCYTFAEYHMLLNDLLIEEGEIPTQTYSDLDIKDDIKDWLIRGYTEEQYQPIADGRLQQATSTNGIGRWDERGDCLPGITFWSNSTLSCVPCPSFDGVTFSKEQSLLKGQSRSNELLVDEFYIASNESFTVSIAAEFFGVPDNTVISPRGTSAYTQANSTVYLLEPGDRLVIGIAFDPSERMPGADTSSLVFQIAGVNHSVFCPERMMRYGIEAQLSLSASRNYLGGVAAFGYAAAAFIIIMSLSLATWVTAHKKTRVVASMQPFFLKTVCFGILLIGASLVPTSMDDGAYSQRVCNVACMAVPWLQSLGFSITVAALFAKIWRINQVFHQQRFRRVVIREWDVFMPSLAPVGVLLVLLLNWSIQDPLVWERKQVEEQPWITYGTCAMGDGWIGRAMLISISAVCSVYFLMTGAEAFRARNISSEFSESKCLGLAIFSWVQLSFVGVPVMFLVEKDNVVASYSLNVGLVLAVCMSMLLVVFVPIMVVRSANIRRSIIRVTGVGFQESSEDEITNRSPRPTVGLEDPDSTKDRNQSSSSRVSAVSDVVPPASSSSVLRLKDSMEESDEAPRPKCAEDERTSDVQSEESIYPADHL